MRRSTAILPFLLALAVPLRSQDVFELLRKGDIPAVKATVEKSPRLVEARDGQGLTLLHYAAYGQSPDLVEFLIDKGAKPDAADPDGDTPLHIAAMSDRTEVAAALLKRGAAVEARNDYQRTAARPLRPRAGPGGHGPRPHRSRRGRQRRRQVRLHRPRARRLARQGRAHRPAPRKGGHGAGSRGEMAGRSVPRPHPTA